MVAAAMPHLQLSHPSSLFSWLVLCVLVGSSAVMNRSPLHGEIASLSYHKYLQRSGLNRTWNLNVLPGYRIRLQFTHLDIAREGDTCQDYVKLEDRWKPSLAICGNQTLPSGRGSQDPLVFYSTSNMITVVFHSTGPQQERLGTFSAQYTAVDIDECRRRNGRCQQLCLNYPGGFACSCYVGYSLRPDNQTCELTVVNCPEPKLLTNGDFTYQTEPDINTYRSVIQYKCNEPYYSMATQSGTFTCNIEGLWKDIYGSDVIPHCLPVCGKPDNPVSSVGKIFGGSNAAVGNFPWQVFLFTGGPGGGALISDRWILTAAHVIHLKGGDNTKYPASDVQVYMGGLTVDEQIKIGPFPVESVVIHPDYTTAEHDFNHDIALIKLRDSVTMNHNIMPVCLPWTSNKPFYEEGIIGYVSGFGIDENLRLSKKLKYATLPVVSQNKCRVFISDKKIHDKTPVFSENMFCAGYPKGKTVNKDSCGGDAGGAFTVREQETERWFAPGIVSWGLNCGRGYGFYTNVNNYRDWIEAVMKEPPELSLWES